MCSRKGRCKQESKGWQEVRERGALGRVLLKNAGGDGAKKGTAEAGTGSSTQCYGGMEKKGGAVKGPGLEMKGKCGPVRLVGRGRCVRCALRAARWHALATAQGGQEHSGQQGHSSGRLVAQHCWEEVGRGRGWKGGGATGRCWGGGCQAGTREGGRHRGLEWKDRQGEEVALHVLYGLGDTLVRTQRGIRRLRQGQGPRQPCPH